MPARVKTLATWRALSGSSARSVSGFRNRVLMAMMVLVTGVTALALYLSERNLTSSINTELQGEFDAQLKAFDAAQRVRHAELIERCRALVDRPRIHAALEDNALDLLYPSAEDVLRDVMTPSSRDELDGTALRARFYRFLDRNGALISAPPDAPIGHLAPKVEAKLALPRLADTQQVGYIATPDGANDTVTEVIATPIVSTETGEKIAALVLGFKPLDLPDRRDVEHGFWTDGKLYFPDHEPNDGDELERAVAGAVARNDRASERIALGRGMYLMFVDRLNAASLYPAAYRVSLFSLDRFAARETQLRFRVIAAGALLLALAFFASHVIARRLAAPVEQLAAESERSARFSANASHQLKTPVTVLRAGLEELLTRDNLTPDECDAIAALIHQTYRLSSLIEDLLLLSRMDAGRLKLALGPVDLRHLIAGALDDLGALPDEVPLQIETDLPPVLCVRGEQRYTTIILQNLLENARKYNVPGGRIRVVARLEGETVLLSIANTGRPITAAAQAGIFERFHRGAIGEDVPGYGLGLNLARELARLHQGDLRLVRSDEEWTEFEVRFRVAEPAFVPA